MVTVFLLLASLVAAAGFAVVAQRRLRQLGMLAAVGATHKHLRLVLLTNGVVVGVTAALIGTIAGVAAWTLAAPTLESAIDHRVDRLSLPWGLIAMTVVLAVIGATAAAWWPGRTVARLPIMLALSGRPPRPRPARHSAIAAAALIAVGIGCLALSNRDRALLIVAGIVATILGCLLLGPLAIRMFSTVAGRVSIAPRLALRDLARYQARSGAALAAVTLALGIAATVVITASAEEANAAGDPPNLSNRQIRVYLGPDDARELSPILTAAELERLAASARQLATQLDDAVVITLRGALQPGTRPTVVDDVQVFPPVGLTRKVDTGAGRKTYYGESQVYVATPAVLRYLGIDPATVDPSIDFLADPAVRTDDLVIPNFTSKSDEFPVTNVQRIDVGKLFGSPGDTADQKPPTFITLDGVRRRGWQQVPVGWLIESSRPLTSDQIADARELAADVGLSIEVLRGDKTLATTMAIATAAGALLALAILALTVGLIRSESARRPTHADRNWSHPPDTPHADGRHRRRACPPRCAPRRRRRVRPPCRDVPRRPRLSERRAGPLPRPRGHRLAAGCRRGGMAPRRPRAACHLPGGLRVTGVRFRLLAIMAALGAVAAAAVLVVTFATGDDDRYSAEIRRTQYGIPHILASDYGSLGYGYGYAFAEDNLCVLADRVLTLRGQRSRYLDPEADSGDSLADPGITNLTSDIYYRGLRQSGVVERLLARPAPLGPTDDLHEMVEGYVAGYNRYLHDTGVAQLPDPTCRGKAWVGPITALDVWSGIYDLTTSGGTAGFREEIVSASPAAGAPVATEPAPTAPAEQPDGTGSNAWALGRDATRARGGMLLANPHWPWTGHARYYQVQLTIPGVLDVAGASVSGTPVVEIGHTRGLAWMHPVSTARRFTLFQLELVPGKPTSYLVDGRAEPMTQRNVTVTVRGTDGKLSRVTRTLYGSRYGPVLAAGWTTRTAFAIRDASADNLRAMNEWLAIDKAQNLAQLRAAQDIYQGIPFSYTIAVDTSGTAYFAEASVVPHVTDAHARRCIDTAEGKALYSEIFVLDGSTSACDWGNDPGAVERGIFAPSNVPRLIRTDYVANSNDSPWLTNPAAPITGYPAIFGDNGSERSRSLRTRLGLDMIARRMAGSDGLGPPGFTLSSLQATMFGNRNYGADLGRSDVVAMCRAHPVLTAGDGTRVDVRAACDVLARWDGRGEAGSRGEALWEMFFQGEPPWRVPFDPAHPLTTPRGIDGDDPAVRRAFADAVRFFQSDPTSGSARRWAGVSLPGCPDEQGCFNAIQETASETGPPPGETGPPPGARGQRPVDMPPATSIHGTSFLMAVELTAHGPRTRTILTHSESANPASPHYRDQTVLFSRKQWVTERFTEAEISADPHLQTTTLHG